MRSHAGRGGRFVSPSSHLSQDDTYWFVPPPGSSVFRNPLFFLTQIEIARYSPINSTTWEDRAERGWKRGKPGHRVRTDAANAVHGSCGRIVSASAIGVFRRSREGG